MSTSWERMWPLFKAALVADKGESAGETLRFCADILDLEWEKAQAQRDAKVVSIDAARDRAGAGRKKK